MHNTKKVMSTIISVLILLLSLVYSFELAFQVIFSDPPLDTPVENIWFYSLMLDAALILAMGILSFFSRHRPVFRTEIVLALVGIIAAIAAGASSSFLANILVSLGHIIYFLLVLLFAYYNFNNYSFKSQH